MPTAITEDGRTWIPYGVFTSLYRGYAEVEKQAREKTGCYVSSIETRTTVDGEKAYSIKIYMELKDGDGERVPARHRDISVMDQDQ